MRAEGTLRLMTSAGEAIPLTSLSHGAGCACKIDAGQLAAIRKLLPPTNDPSLIVGLDPADDAAVYQLTDDLALVQTVDFFTPIVDDPFDFGRIAATNALSDIYAMGATPKIALNILAISLDSLGATVLAKILRGGAEVVSAAGASVAGGHSVDDSEPKYGLAVTGIAHPTEIIAKGGGRAGDLLYLTKPIGAGLICTAAKRGRAPSDSLSEAISVMTDLNALGAAQAREAGASAMTDVTGFGLLGHLHELCMSSGLAAEIEAGAVPAISRALDLAVDPVCRAGGSLRNAEHAATFTKWDSGVSESQRVLLTDAMTSGGLLLSVSKQDAESAPGTPIGRLTDGPGGRIRVR